MQLPRAIHISGRGVDLIECEREIVLYFLIDSEKTTEKDPDDGHESQNAALGMRREHGAGKLCNELKKLAGVRCSPHVH